MHVYINITRSRFSSFLVHIFEFWDIPDLWDLSHNFLIIRMYKKKSIWYQISEKILSLAGARTHENETRPEEIYDNERVCLLSE